MMYIYIGMVCAFVLMAILYWTKAKHPKERSGGGWGEAVSEILVAALITLLWPLLVPVICFIGGVKYQQNKNNT